jgi:hypothetical protein
MVVVKDEPLEVAILYLLGRFRQRVIKLGTINELIR